MAIGRVAGPLLYSDLDRQGVDLQFSTNNEPLLFLDFANFRAAINSNTLNTTETFTVTGNALMSNVKIDDTTLSSTLDLTLAATGNINLGDIVQTKITGGADNHLMTTDGTGNLSWKSISEVSALANLTGANVAIGSTTDGSVVDYAAYRYWTDNTSISDAVDNLNQVMLNVYQDTYVGVGDFTANVVAGPSPMTVAFTATTLGNPTSYEWDFGDGNFSTLRNPTHTFSNDLGGQYTVYFKALNAAGTRNATGNFGNGALAQGSYADSNKIDYITLFTPLPIPAFSLDAVSIDDHSSVSFTNLSQYAESYVINWGDGSTSPVADNADPGGTLGGTIIHTYDNIAGDTLYSVTLDAFSSTAGPIGETVSSVATDVRVYGEHSPVFIVAGNPSGFSIGNNQHLTLPHGLVIGFTNTTGTAPGVTSTFANNRYQWNWDDGTTSNVSIGSGALGDLGQTITHAFTLVDPKVQQTFNANLQVFNGNSTSPFSSVDWPVTVIPAPTSLFEGNLESLSDRIGDTAQTGYLFTDLQGMNRANVIFNNLSFNSNVYNWSFGDSFTSGSLNEGAQGTPTGITLPHLYTSTGTFSVSLLAHGPSSLNASDDTLLKSNYINILTPPAAPDGLGSKTITLTSVGTTPLLASGATDLTPTTAPPAGTAVTRITTVDPIETTEILDAYNAFTGNLQAVINGVAESNISLSGANDVGVFGSLVITDDRDAHAVSPSIYPSEFYKVFSGKLSKANASVSVGYNSYQMVHTTTGATNVLNFVKDDVLLAPTLDATLMTMNTTNLGTPLYMSGVPYYNVGGTAAILGVTAYNWIGQTYLNSSTPMSVGPGSVVAGSGDGIVVQTKSYAQLDGTPTYLSSGIPIANTGKTSGTAYVLGSVPVIINGIAASTSKITMQLSNVNGTGTQIELSKLINVHTAPISGFNETSIPVSLTLGGAYTDNGKRIFIPGASGATPSFLSATNYYTTAPFTGAIPVAGTDEAIVRFGTLAHNTTNFSQYLPVGPDLSGRGATQYFRFAFRRSTVANFTLTYSGKISGLMIASPNTQIDATSTLNKWIDATIVYAGAGIPGENTGNGGNGSNGCAKTAGDVIPVGSLVSNRACVLTLGSANSSDATGNTILVSVALNPGDSITAISIS